MTRVLLVEDDEASSLYAALALQRHGYDVLAVATGTAAEQAAQQTQIDVILPDIGLPDTNGIQACRRLRALTKAPIIFLSRETAEVAKVLGLDAGGDNFITKPFSVGELTARIRAVMRRAAPDSAEAAERLEAGGIVLDLASHKVIVQGDEIFLTPKEFELLRILMSAAGHLVSRQKILEALWGPDFFGDANVLDVHVRQLRRKLEGDSGRPHCIQTIRGFGYSFTAPPVAPT